jgi:hypothetical protein
VKRIVVAGGAGLLVVLIPIILMSLADTGLARVLAFTFLQYPAMLVSWATGGQASFWAAGALAWVLWSVVIYTVLWLVHRRVGSSPSVHA